MIHTRLATSTTRLQKFAYLREHTTPLMRKGYVFDPGLTLHVVDSSYKSPDSSRQPYCATNHLVSISSRSESTNLPVDILMLGGLQHATPLEGVRDMARWENVSPPHVPVPLTGTSVAKRKPNPQSWGSPFLRLLRRKCGTPLLRSHILEHIDEAFLQ